MAFNPVMIQSIVALGCGVFIMLAPRLLSTIVAFYLMFVGLNAMWPSFWH
jgi:multisubunit Na+/H+ antiporter MnhC subunit